MTETQTTKRGAAFWVGWVLTVLPCLATGFSGVMKIAHVPAVLEGFQHFGYPESTLTVIGSLEVIVTLLVLIPRTAVLGSILFAAYLGGAVATHGVRIGGAHVDWPRAHGGAGLGRAVAARPSPSRAGASAFLTGESVPTLQLRSAA